MLARFCKVINGNFRLRWVPSGARDAGFEVEVGVGSGEAEVHESVDALDPGDGAVVDHHGVFSG